MSVISKTRVKMLPPEGMTNKVNRSIETLETFLFNTKKLVLESLTLYYIILYNFV